MEGDGRVTRHQNRFSFFSLRAREIRTKSVFLTKILNVTCGRRHDNWNLAVKCQPPESVDSIWGPSLLLDLLLGIIDKTQQHVLVLSPTAVDDCSVPNDRQKLERKGLFVWRRPSEWCSSSEGNRCCCTTSGQEDSRKTKHCDKMSEHSWICQSVRRLSLEIWHFSWTFQRKRCFWRMKQKSGVCCCVTGLLHSRTLDQKTCK